MAVAVGEDQLSIVTPAEPLEVAALRSGVFEAARCRPGLLVVDLRAVSSLDSSCIAVLTAARRVVRQGGGKIALINVTHGVLAVLHRAGLERVFDVRPLSDPPLAPEAVLPQSG